MGGLSLEGRRLLALASRSRAACGLALDGRLVVTEAASGAYACTSVLAAMAGADVVALAKPSRYGSVQEIREWTGHLARAAGVENRVTVVEALSADLLGDADVVTNSGHLRPLDAAFVQQLKPGAVVPLMMEAWEVAVGRVDVDLDALTRRGIRFAGTNERNPAVGVFEYLGVMAVKLLTDAKVSVQATRLTLVCDNPFAPYLLKTLRACGAEVSHITTPQALMTGPPADAVLVALTPTDGVRVTSADLAALGRHSPGVVLAQFFGDVDRTAAQSSGVVCWPDQAPPHGHMGVLPSDIGPEPVVRLQAGGLRVAQVLLKAEEDRTPADLEFLDVL